MSSKRKDFKDSWGVQINPNFKRENLIFKSSQTSFEIENKNNSYWLPQHFCLYFHVQQGRGLLI